MTEQYTRAVDPNRGRRVEDAEAQPGPSHNAPFGHTDVVDCRSAQGRAHGPLESLH